MAHRRSGLRWVFATTARWALGAGALVSFTAAAGYDPRTGASVIAQSADIGGTAALVPSSAALGGFGPLYVPVDDVVRRAALKFDGVQESELSPNVFGPRSDLKSNAKTFPALDRSRKTSPLAGLRPSLSRRALEMRTGSLSRLLYGRGEPTLAAPLVPGPAADPDLDSEPGFVRTFDDKTTTVSATAAVSPAASASDPTGAGRLAAAALADGSTPSVPRAVALSSTTPAPADSTPIEIAAAPVSAPLISSRLDRGQKSGVTTAARSDSGEKPRYADLIDPDHLAREQRCLAEAVYFEARSEPAEGQAAVAQVVLNRVKSGLYPASVCGVVYQNRNRHLACQFTFACEGKSLRIADGESWQNASRVAQEVMEGKTYLADVGAATHYHADYVRPRWARRLKKMDVIGRHIFYRLRPGQT